VGDGAGAVDQHPDLAADLGGQLGQLSRELVGDQAVGGDVAPE